jgi:hypothetical protein
MPPPSPPPPPERMLLNITSWAAIFATRWWHISAWIRQVSKVDETVETVRVSKPVTVRITQSTDLRVSLDGVSESTSPCVSRAQPRRSLSFRRMIGDDLVETLDVRPRAVYRSARELGALIQ